MKRENLSTVGAIVLILILSLLLSKGVVNMSEVSSWIVGVLVTSIFGILIWGFKPRIERAIRGKETKGKNAKEMAKALAGETQRLRKKEDANKMHRDAVYGEIDSLLSKDSDFLVLQDWLSYPDPDSFPEELSHLEAYNALDVAKTVKQLCDNFNADLRKAIDDTMEEFEKKLSEKERVEGKKLSMQCYDIVPHPDRYYSPDILAWNVYHDAGAFQPYEIEPIQGREGWYRIGNTVAQTDNRAELEWFTELANDYSLGKVELFKKLHDRKRGAIAKRKEFSDALAGIKKKLNSGHSLEGKCGLCPNADDVENGLAELRRVVKNKVDETCVND